MASILSLIIIVFLALVAVIAAAPSPFRLPEVDPLEDGEEPIIEKRVPHPSWRSNVRINHIQHHDGSPFLNYNNNGKPRSFFNQWAMRPY